MKSNLTRSLNQLKSGTCIFIDKFYNVGDQNQHQFIQRYSNISVIIVSLPLLTLSCLPGVTLLPGFFSVPL